MAIVFVIVAFVIALLLPKRIKKVSLIIASLSPVIVLLFFIVRPFWIDYQASKKTEQIIQHLEEQYPDQEWITSRREGRHTNPYHLEVVFENEKGWTYTYAVVDEQYICQIGWTPPEGKLPDEGQHYEFNTHCE